MSAPSFADPIDKSGWGDGAWQDEPDELDFNFGDVRCRIVRQPRAGALNGYVCLPPGHPWIDKDLMSYSDPGFDPPEVHGGVSWHGTFGDATYATKTDEAVWVGFDCNHAFDFAPGMASYYAGWSRHPDEVYRDIAYVRGQTERLAKQAIRAMINLSS